MHEAPLRGGEVRALAEDRDRITDRGAAEAGDRKAGLDRLRVGHALEVEVQPVSITMPTTGLRRMSGMVSAIRLPELVSIAAV